MATTGDTHSFQLNLLLLLCGVWGTQGIRIINCNNNKVEIFEDSPAPVTCGDIPGTSDVVWRLGDGVNIGECKADGTCTTALYNDYRLSRLPQSTESQLTLVPDYRRHAGVTVVCQDRNSGSIVPASCTLVIRRHSELSECHVTTNPVDGTVSGSCRVQQAFSSDNIYTCTWTRNDGQQTFGEFDASRELCSFIQALPQAGGLYTYSISVSPPATTAFSQQLTLGAGNVSVVSTTNTVSSSPAVVGPIVGGIVAAVVIAIIASLLAIFIRRQRRHLKMIEEPRQSSHLAPPTDNHGYEDVHIRSINEETATTQLREADMYENTQRLADTTYDTPGRGHDEHQYSDLQVKATQ